MKRLLSFFAAFYVFTRTCHGYNVTHINMIFVNNVMDPDKHELAEVKNLMALPLTSIRNSAWSLMTNFGMLQNYSIIFSKEPDLVETIPSLELEHPSMIPRFEKLTNNCTSNSGNVTLKGLRKALEMSSKNSVIFLVANKKTNDSEMLNEILYMMYKKRIPVFVLVVEKTTSTFQPILSNMTTNFPQLAVTVLEQDVDKMGSEYHAILQATRSIGFLTAVRAIEEKFELELARGPFYDIRSFAIVYDVINPTEGEIVRISEVMLLDAASYFRLRYKLSEETYSVIFSSKESHLLTRFRAFQNSTDKDFKDMIKSQQNKIEQKVSLRTLLKTLQTIPVSSWIVYYVNEHPEDEYEVLSEIVQLIIDKRIKIDVKSIRDYATPELRTPVAYRTISEISWRVRSSSSAISPNWIMLLVIITGLFTVKFMI